MIIIKKSLKNERQCECVPAESLDELLTDRGRGRGQCQELFVFVFGTDPALFVFPTRLRIGFASSWASLPDAVAHRVAQTQHHCNMSRPVGNQSINEIKRTWLVLYSDNIGPIIIKVTRSSAMITYGHSSRSKERTREMCEPRFLWMPEHSMQTRIPRFKLAQSGSVRQQRKPHGQQYDSRLKCGWISRIGKLTRSITIGTIWIAYDGRPEGLDGGSVHQTVHSRLGFAAFVTLQRRLQMQRLVDWNVERNNQKLPVESWGSGVRWRWPILPSPRRWQLQSARSCCPEKRSETRSHHSLWKQFNRLVKWLHLNIIFWLKLKN